MKLTTKLLDFLHRIFDTDPAQFLVFRIGYDGTLAWKVDSGTFSTTVTGGSGSALSVDLSTLSLLDLAVFLSSQPGYSVSFVDSSALMQLSGLVLLDASGDNVSAYGDRIYGFTNWLYSYTGAQSVELVEAGRQVSNMLEQMNVVSADGDWLDVHGSYLGVPRLVGELDAQYSPRIIAEVLRPRSNNVALEAAILAYTGQVTTVVDVVSYQSVTNAHDTSKNHNSEINYNSSSTPVYGLFDVTTAYDLLSGSSLSQFRAILSGIIDRIRSAGTQLRALNLDAGTVVDTVTTPTDAISTLSLTAALSDTAAGPTSDVQTMAISMSALNDSVAAPSDANTLEISFGYSYGGLRTYGGVITHQGGTIANESL